MITKISTLMQGMENNRCEEEDLNSEYQKAPDVEGEKNPNKVRDTHKENITQNRRKEHDGKVEKK